MQLTIFSVNNVLRTFQGARHKEEEDLHRQGGRLRGAHPLCGDLSQQGLLSQRTTNVGGRSDDRLS